MMTTVTLEPPEQAESPGLSAVTTGVFPGHLLKWAAAQGWIDAGDRKILHYQPASLDLRLGEKAYSMRCSFLPNGESIERKLKDYVLDEIDLRGDGGVLRVGHPYLVELRERLDLPAFVAGKANPKSSTGRLDVFTRLLTDCGYGFDEIPPGYAGPLWLEIVPLSFSVRVKEGTALNQLRLSIGRPQVTDDELRAIHQQTPLLYLNGEPVADVELFDGLFLALDLQPGGPGTEPVVYRAREHAPVIDMTKERAAAPEDFWEFPRVDGDRAILGPKGFYLVMSKEAVSIPPTLAAEMTAYDPTSGELRTHYAGFFDPGFGYGPSAPAGSRAALEVRVHDVPFLVEHGQRVCKLTFERLIEAPEVAYGAAGSHYQGQTGALGKHFGPLIATPPRRSRPQRKPADAEPSALLFEPGE